MQTITPVSKGTIHHASCGSKPTTYIVAFL